MSTGGTIPPEYPVCLQRLNLPTTLSPSSFESTILPLNCDANWILELMQSLNHLVQSGKVLYLGISDTPAWVVR